VQRRAGSPRSGFHACTRPLLHHPLLLASPLLPVLQVTPDQYLNTEPFMDAVAATFKAKRAAKA
jgi:hypothetical protein